MSAKKKNSNHNLNNVENKKIKEGSDKNESINKKGFKEYENKFQMN